MGVRAPRRGGAASEARGEGRALQDAGRGRGQQSGAERLEPALGDVRVPGATKKGKVNQAEALALVRYLGERLGEGGELERARWLPDKMQLLSARER